MTDPGSLRCSCPDCGTDLWDRRAGEWTLANRIMKVGDDGAVSARCPKGCGDVAVPFMQVVTPPDPPKEVPVRKGRRRLVVRRST